MRENEYFPEKKLRRFPQLTNVVLVGLPGSGKSVIGKHLAWQLGLGFFDLDAAIEVAQKKNIAEIFLEQGVQAFRDFESCGIAQLLSIRNHVVSVGGGALEIDKNLQNLMSVGVLIWIDTPVTALAWRLTQNVMELKKRPLFADLCKESDRSYRRLTLQTRLEGLLAERGRGYESAAITFRDSASPPEVCARRLIHMLDRYFNRKKHGKNSSHS